MNVKLKVNFSINNKTKVEYYDEEIEPEIVITTSEGVLVEIFGSKDELRHFANELYQVVNKEIVDDSIKVE